MVFGLLGPAGPWRRSAAPRVALDALTFQTRAKLPLAAPADGASGYPVMAFTIDSL